MYMCVRAQRMQSIKRPIIYGIVLTTLAENVEGVYVKEERKKFHSSKYFFLFFFIFFFFWGGARGVYILKKRGNSK